MPIDHPTEQTLGVHLDGDSVLFAPVKLGKGGVEVGKLLSLNNVKPVDFEELVKSHMVIAGTDETLLIRPLHLPMVKEGALDSALPLQMDSLLPYPVEEGILEKIILQKGEKETFLNAIAIKKEAVTQLVEKFQGLGLDPEVVSIPPLALTQFAYFVKKSEEPRFCLHLGKKISLIATLGEKLVAHFTTDEMKEVKKGLLAIKKKYPFQFSDTLYVIGDDQRVQEIEGPYELCENTTWIPFAIPIGYALSGLPERQSLNLLKGDLAYKKPLKRLKKTLAIYFASMGMLTLAAYLFGQTYLSYQEDQLKEAFAEALYQKVDEEKEISSLTLDELEEEIYKWQKSIQATPNLFALHPNVPRVADLLGWLSGFPNLELVQLSYTMVKRPEMSRKEEKYQVKVELEFSTETPRLAREFHDALIAPNDFVDPKGEIKWSTSRGSYKTSFYLKDKTFYP